MILSERGFLAMTVTPGGTGSRNYRSSVPSWRERDESLDEFGDGRGVVRVAMRLLESRVARSRFLVIAHIGITSSE
jgi:hypothetical protein